MKIKNVSSKNRKAGVTMTEYLILLALVAVASLVMTMAFGKQVKTVFKASIDALGGTKTATIGTAAPTTVEASTMDTFAVTAGN